MGCPVPGFGVRKWWWWWWWCVVGCGIGFGCGGAGGGGGTILTSVVEAFVRLVGMMGVSPEVFWWVVVECVSVWETL